MPKKNHIKIDGDNNITIQDAQVKGNIIINKNNPEVLKKSIDLMSLKFQFEYPSNDIVVNNNPFTAKGIFEGEIPNNYQIYFLAKDTSRYYLMWPEMEIIENGKKWEQTNIRLNTDGIWKLFLCLANENAKSWFRNKANRNDWSGFEILPDGTKLITNIIVKMKN